MRNKGLLFRLPISLLLFAAPLLADTYKVNPFTGKLDNAGSTTAPSFVTVGSSLTLNGPVDGSTVGGELFLEHASGQDVSYRIRTWGNILYISRVSDTFGVVHWVQLDGENGVFYLAGANLYMYSGAMIQGPASIVVGATVINASAIMQADSTTQGFLPPRMTTTQRDNIVSPSEGLHIYNLSTHAGNYFNGSIWVTY